VESAAGKWLAETKGNRPDRWASPSVELKGTLTEGAGSGAALIVPQYVPGIVPSVLPPPVVAQLFAPGTTTTGLVNFMRETLFTNAAAPVAEGTAKPESALTFELVSEPLHKIAHWLPATEEILDDVAQMQSYIDSRLRLGVLVELDDQLLNGSGLPPEMNGLLVRADLTAPIAAPVGGSLDAIAQQISNVEIASGLRVDAIGLHPSDWMKLLLTKTNGTSNEYLAGSPFETPVQPTLFGKRVGLSTAFPAGVALVGAFGSGGGQLFTHGGVRVAA
jgi:HK97 family phage major capsid protein